jgi:MFS family permease
MAGRHGLLAALLDASFTELMTQRMAGAVYGGVVAGLGIVTGAVVAYGVARDPGFGLVFVIGAAAAFVVLVLIVRLLLEAAVVLVRIADQTEEIAEQVAGMAVGVARTERMPAVDAMERRSS